MLVQVDRSEYFAWHTKIINHIIIFLLVFLLLLNDAVACSLSGVLAEHTKCINAITGPIKNTSMKEKPPSDHNDVAASHWYCTALTYHNQRTVPRTEAQAKHKSLPQQQEIVRTKNSNTSKYHLCPFFGHFMQSMPMN